AGESSARSGALRGVEVDTRRAPGLGEPFPAGMAVAEDPAGAILVPVGGDRAGELVHLVVAVGGLRVSGRIEPGVVDVVAVGIDAGECLAPPLRVDDRLRRPSHGGLVDAPDEVAVDHV